MLAALVVVIVAILLILINPLAGSSGGRKVNDAGSRTTTVLQESLTSETSSSGTLGFAGRYSVVNDAAGTLTWLPAAGRIVREGGVLYQVSGSPVILLTGRVPIFRALSDGMAGRDVEQLNRDLVSLGYATRAELSATSDEFTGATVDALELLQKHLGVTDTGTLALGRAVFLPVARLRVTGVFGTLGTSARPGPLLAGSSARRVVSLELDAGEQSEVAVGDRVSITLPDNSTTPGVVSSIGTVASAGQNGGSPMVPMTVTPRDPSATGSIDQAPVDVAVTTGFVKRALVVPVDALLALAGGGYAVEEVAAGGRRHLVGISLGLFDDADGLVQVTGSGIAAGQRVVVPSL